ncbi:MAG TPA: hypothetical protein VFQ76_11345, partial [Longimicrobiaceae bacterium]|nr:hypothetical protein [Longimicrobiaceae bacterium]
MNRIPSRRGAILAALLSCLLLPAVFLAQGTGPKAMVVCPPTDAAGCQRIAEQLRLTKSATGATAFPGGVHTKYEELRTMTVPELQSYAVVFVPSMANAPYGLLREDAVKLRLSQVLRGRIAVWSGTPDRGSATGKSAGKLTLIQNLARWAAGQYSDGSTGLVVLQDFSDPNPDGSSPRYDWIPGIAGARVNADATVRSYNSVETNTANPAAAQIVAGLAFDNMASFGLTVPTGSGVVGAWGLTGSGKNASRGQAVLVTFSRVPSISHPVGPAGGTITSGRVTLSIPEGALSQTTAITIQPVGPLPDSGYVGNTAYSFGPDGLTFAKPATLTIRYDQGDVPSYVMEDSLYMFRQGENSTTWEEIEESASDPGANRVVGS